MNYKLPSWLRTRRPPSIHVIADQHLEEWPLGDQYCKLTYCQHLPLSQWLEHLRTQQLTIKAHNVVLYLHKLRHETHLTLLKNRLAQLCRVVRAAAPECRIFLSDMLPTESTLENDQITRHNGQLFIAVQHVNCDLERVFYLSMRIHFNDIVPWMDYFKRSGELTRLGCLTFRGCLAREVGITNYTL